MKSTPSSALGRAARSHSFMGGYRFPHRHQLSGLLAAVLFGTGLQAQSSWQSRDIGTSTTGSTTVSGDVVTIQGSGRDIWETSDGFRFYYQEVSGDFDLVARVASLGDTNDWAKAGLMVRGTTDPGSPQGMICLTSRHGTAFQWREQISGSTSTSAPTEDGPAPRWLKLVRRGTVFEGYASTDGVNWTPAGATFRTTSNMLLVGLAVTSHNDGVLCTARFEQVTLTTAPPAPSNLRVVRRGERSVELAWTDNSGGTSGFLIESRPAVRDSTYAVVGSVGPNVTQFTATGLGEGSFYEFVVSARKAPDGPISQRSDSVAAQITETPRPYVTTVTSNSISLQWGQSSQIIGFPAGTGPYAVERSLNNSSFVEIARGIRGTYTSGDHYNSRTVYTDTTVSPATTYYYRVRYLDENGDTSGYGTTPAVTTSGSSSPAAPTIVSITPGTPTSGGATTTASRWTFNGTAPANAAIELHLSSVRDVQAPPNATLIQPGTLATVTADASGAWSWAITRSSFYPGVYQFFTTLSGGPTPGGPNFTVTVQASATQPPVVSNATITGQVGTPITPVTITATNNPVEFRAQLDQWGLVLDSITGTISGTPSAPVSGAQVTVTAFNSVGTGTGTVTLNLSSSSGSIWQSRDIGTSTAGSTNVSGSTVTLGGSGWDIWETFDGFRFHYLTLNGDGYITARVVSQQNTHGWAKAGVMIRQSLDPNASNVFVAATPDHGVVTQFRSGASNSTGQLAGPAINVPYWVRLSRTGNIYNAAYSLDGSAWHTFEPITWVAMPTSTYIGLAVTSHSDGTVCSATFDNVSLTTSTSPPPPPPPPPQPGPWSFGDIGAVGLAGSNVSSGNTITIRGSGADIWDNADAFRFVWQSRTGDGIVEARITSLENTNPWAKAGVMIRETNDPGARNVFVALTPSWHGVIAQSRASPSASTTLADGPAVSTPYWIRLARTSNTFTASASSDGVAWTPFATFDVAMSATANFGFAVTSHDNSRLNEAIFTDPYVGTQ